MSTTLIWAFVCLIIFVAVLAHPKLPNWMTFICMAPVVLLAKVMEAKDIYAVLNSSSLHLMIIICMFSGMIAATGLDIIIGDFVDHMTSSQTGKKKEMMIFAIVYLVSGLISTVLQNSYVALAFLPVLKSIARKNRISLSKLVLFVIFATTLGGAITLIGTPTNVYANTALEEAGLQLFGMLDFAWVGIPIFIVGLRSEPSSRACGRFSAAFQKSAPADLRSLPRSIRSQTEEKTSPASVPRHRPDKL